MEAVRPRRIDPLEGGAVNEALSGAIVQTCAFVMRTAFRLSMADVPPLPDGPLILAPNHRSFLDPIVVASVAQRRVHFMMHARYHDIPSMRWLYETVRCIPVESEEGNRKALRAGQRVLEAGRVLGLFPEGTISPDGRLGEGQPGLAWLARRTGAPVYPLCLGGTREALARGSNRVHFVRLTARLGAPLRAVDFNPGRAGAEQLTAALMDALEALGARR